jgi:recombination protein RecA
MALKGGLGYGRQVLVWGNKSAGKSSFCLQMIALAQKEGKTCAWIDAEASYDPAWAEAIRSRFIKTNLFTSKNC